MWTGYKSAYFFSKKNVGGEFVMEIWISNPVFPRTVISIGLIYLEYTLRSEDDNEDRIQHIQCILPYLRILQSLLITPNL